MIEVGMYVRSKINGRISKITDIEQFEELGKIVERYILDNNYNVGFCSTEKDSVKASYNIIDLIEVGDYVNGYRVRGKTNEKVVVDYYCYSEELAGGNWLTFYKDNINSIVTKEQFEQVEYRIGENENEHKN